MAQGYERLNFNQLNSLPSHGEESVARALEGQSSSVALENLPISQISRRSLQGVVTGWKPFESLRRSCELSMRGRSICISFWCHDDPRQEMTGDISSQRRNPKLPGFDSWHRVSASCFFNYIQNPCFRNRNLMVAKSKSWWPRATVFGLIAWKGGSPLSALADIGEPRIGVVIDSHQCPQSFAAEGLAASELLSLKSLLSFDPAFADVFAIYVVNPEVSSTDEVNPPVSGNYWIDGKRLNFIPRHPLKPGLTYRAVLKVRGFLDSAENSPMELTIEQEITVPRMAWNQSVPTKVEQVYPTSNVVAENHLRFYIHFSHPIARGAAYQNLELLDENGSRIEDAFLAIGEELWDLDCRRFTLLLDPGRVKRGLKLREELGPVLENGKKYTLKIKREWRDEHDQLLSADFCKEFTVGPAIESAINLKHSTVSLPVAGTKQPLEIDFPRSIDYALLERSISVADSSGERIPGRIQISPAERNWSFVPDQKWLPAIYQLLIDGRLEDPSGNRIRQPVEIDGETFFTRKAMNEIIRLPFEISTSQLPATAKAGTQPVPGTRR